MIIKSQNLDISIVIPVFNEDENIRNLAFEINEALKYYLQHIELEPDTIYKNIIVRYHIGFERLGFSFRLKLAQFGRCNTRRIS